MPPTPKRIPFARTLTARVILATCVAALVSVLVTALVAFPLAARAANTATRSALSDKATFAAEILSTRTTAPAKERALANQLRRSGVDLYLIRNGRSDRTGIPPRFINDITAGQDVTDGGAVIGGHAVLVEGRTLGGGDGVILVEQTVGVARLGISARLLFALLAGLLAGLVAGALLASRLARPIRNAASVAMRLSAGDRSVRLRPEAPVESENLAIALNTLAAALAVSEGRQRDFLLSISHELRTPLTSLKGYAEALADGVVGPDGARQAGQTMVTEANNLERLVTDLLALARLEAADFPVETVPVELIQLIRMVMDGWSARIAAAGLVLRTEIPSVPVIVYTDPGRIRQVIDGLLENALRVAPPGAPIVLAVRGPNPAVPNHGVIEIRDGGPGFTDADLAVVFERGALYERYRGIRKVGSGLGLALAAGLVRRLGGEIEASHAPEGGARFAVLLPTLASQRPLSYQARTSP
jgi:two-component system sensor histidine kinase BaeS